MRKPEGRYFDPVIERLQLLKKQEKITIDQAFKTSLRQNLLTKIATMEPVEVEQRTSFIEKFLQWRYQIAAIPTLLLVFVAVYGLSKLPIAVKDEKFIPGAVPQNENISNSTNNSNQSSQLNTFPGENVLPSNFSGQSDQSNERTNKNTASPQPASNETNPSQPASSSPATNSNPLDSSSNTFNQHPSPPPAPQPSVNPSTTPLPVLTPPPSSLPPQNKNNTASPEVTPPPSLIPDNTPIENSTGTDAQENKDVVSPNTLSVMNTTGIQSGNETQESTNPSNDTSSEITTPPVNTFLPFSPISLNYTVYFNGTFTSSQKTYFEKTLIPSLTEGKAVAYVTVHLQDSNKVMIEVVFMDKSSTTYFYKYDPSTQEWKLDSSKKP